MVPTPASKCKLYSFCVSSTVMGDRLSSCINIDVIVLMYEQNVDAIGWNYVIGSVLSLVGAQSTVMVSMSNDCGVLAFCHRLL